MLASSKRSGTAGRVRQGTYSIVARDEATGELGVAVQSHWFSVGPIVPWARPGVGAVATQANADPGYGPRALDLIAAGASAPQALAGLLAADPAAASRQVAILDAEGRTATHTGADCMAYAGHAHGPGVSCQANIMASESVWGAMKTAFEAAGGPLATRLMAALDAGEAAGGDIRGRQSAALLVVPASGEAWETTVSLRVEDHPEPLTELRRLLALHDAYVLAAQGDELLGAGNFDQAAELYRQALQRAPGNHELLFWAGLGAVQSGHVTEGVEQVRAAIALQPGWAELLPRLTGEVGPAARAVEQTLKLS